MKRVRLVALGIRLAVSGGRPALFRLALMSFGFAVGAALLLSAMSIVPALHARDQRRDQVYGETVRAHATDSLAIWATPQAFGDLEIEARTVEATGSPAPLPGLKGVPAPGEIFVSDRLRSMWDGALGTTLEPRLGAHLAGTIAPSGVLGPDELVMWIGKPANLHLPLRQAEVVNGFGPPPSAADQPLDLAALLITVAIAAAILLPIWLFVATVTRLSAATREARLAAVRLAGGTAGEVRLFAGLEAGLASCGGIILAIPLFFALRPLLAAGVIMGIKLYPADLAPPIPMAIGGLLLIPVVATVMSLGTMRRVFVSPLGVTRRVRRTHAGAWWTVVLAVGVGVLAWCASQHEELVKLGSVTTGILVGIALGCIAFGLVGTAVWASWVVARRLAPISRRAATMLAMRRLESDPSSIGRVVGVVALMIAMVGVMQAGLLAVGRDEPGYSLASWTQALPPDAVIVSSEVAPLDPGADLADIPGVNSVTWSKIDPRGARGTLSNTAVLGTDGTTGTLEAIRDRVAWFAEATSITGLRDRYSGYDEELAGIRKGILMITLFLILVSAATMLVALVDWIMERRRSLAVLSAIGTGTSVLRRSVLLQVALPLVIATVLGLFGAIVVTALLYTAVEQKVLIPFGLLVSLAGITLVIVLLVSALSLPWVRIGSRPELLREA
ncbi:MAG: hypothetical protein M3P18_12000 [Actinomycetota bacterium]|nr:hypothetical protein [Actinomycetota bacterium]